VFFWTPEPFNESTWDKDSKLVKEMNATLGNRRDPKYVGVTCEGENDADVDNMGKVTYFPNAGFPTSFYPYTNAKHYRSPLVFVQFPNAKEGVVMQVWCKLWVQNIKHNKNDKGGSVHFELLIDH
jgi:sodium/potassium-transporting ATPase subunit beta